MQMVMSVNYLKSHVYPSGLSLDDSATIPEVVAVSIVVLKNLLQLFEKKKEQENVKEIVKRLAKLLYSVTNPSTRAIIYN